MRSRNRRGTPCQCHAMANGRCKFHGGMSTGPRTAEGRARISAANRQRWAEYRKPLTPTNRCQLLDTRRTIAPTSLIYPTRVRHSPARDDGGGAGAVGRPQQQQNAQHILLGEVPDRPGTAETHSVQPTLRLWESAGKRQMDRGGDIGHPPHEEAPSLNGVGREASVTLVGAPDHHYVGSCAGGWRRSAVRAGCARGWDTHGSRPRRPYTVRETADQRGHGR